MRKRTATVYVTGCPDTRDIGAKLIIDDNESTLISFDPGLVETEVVGIGGSTHGHQQMAADDFRRAIGTVDVNGHAVTTFFNRHTLGV